MQRLAEYYFKENRPLEEYIDRKIAKLDNILTNWNTIDEEELFDDAASSLVRAAHIWQISIREGVMLMRIYIYVCVDSIL